MDIFEEYISKNKRNVECRALTCRSYKRVYQYEQGEQLSDDRTNSELATYGDALLSFVLCSIMLDKISPLSKRKQKYETDQFLIEKVAKHYNLLEYMNFDRDDDNIIEAYVFYDKTKNGCNNNPAKYIATTVEAVLGALYKYEKYSFDEICELVGSWMELKK